MSIKIECRLCKSENTTLVPLHGIIIDEYEVICRDCGHQFSVISETVEKDVDDDNKLE